ncbi:MAG: anti-sigma factor family protein [Planctomycetota bacterium]|jgi:hypothetical protein
MNCSEVLDLLSPLHDGELSTELTESVEQHLRECSSCAAVRADFGAMSTLTGQQSDPEPPEGLWAEIEAALDAEERNAPTVAPATTSSESRRRLQWGRLAVAVVLFVTAGVIFVVQRPAQHGHDKHLAVNFDQYLTEFPRSAERAQELLHANYPSELVDIDNATLQVKYRPAVANALPEGYTLDSVHLVRMPCCLCVEAMCTAPDGTRLAVMEHAIDQPVWFGDRPSEQCNCNGRKARLVRYGDQYAATWQSEKRFLTVIGIRDENELGQLIQHLDPPEA